MAVLIDAAIEPVRVCERRAVPPRKGSLCRGVAQADADPAQHRADADHREVEACFFCLCTYVHFCVLNAYFDVLSAYFDFFIKHEYGT